MYKKCLKNVQALIKHLFFLTLQLLLDNIFLRCRTVNMTVNMTNILFCFYFTDAARTSGKKILQDYLYLLSSIHHPSCRLRQLGYKMLKLTHLQVVKQPWCLHQLANFKSSTEGHNTL